MKNLIATIPISKVDIKKLAFNYGEELSNNGGILDAFIQSKLLDQFTKDLRDVLMDEVTEEISKHTSDNLVVQGAKAEVRSSTSYDYSGCEDIYLEELILELNEIKTKITLRQNQLKGVKHKQEISHPETGEIYTVFEPQKKSKEIPFITLKKY